MKLARLTEKQQAAAGCVGVLFVAPFAVLLHCWALAVLWDWFIVPVFGLPPLGILQAFGLMLVVRLISPPSDAKARDDDLPYGTVKWWCAAIGRVIAAPTCSLVIGWVVHWAIMR